VPGFYRVTANPIISAKACLWCTECLDFTGLQRRLDVIVT